VKPLYSVVIPLKNEAGNICPLIEEVETVMNSLKFPWELICIDDGSTDGTVDLMNALVIKKAFLRVLVFKKNYGQSSAFDAGFRAALGEFIITLDGDGQNDPADIPKLIELIKDCDLVCGIRLKRKDTLGKRWISKMANAVRQWVCDDGMQDTGCSLKIYRKSCLDKVKMYNGMHRFLPALFKIEGFRLNQVAVNHRERLAGTSHYHFFNRSFNTLADLWAVNWMKKRHLNYQIEKHLPQRNE
jgi:glycosyltransferase involved in cell wall biosynthesis